MYVIIGIDVLLLALAIWFGFFKKRVLSAMIPFVLAVITTTIYSYIVTRMPLAGSPVELFNPHQYVRQSEYVSFWSLMFSTLLMGFWARFIAVTSLIAAFWLGVYRRRTGLGVFMFLISVATTYLFGVLKYFWR